jgi:hypothetical protein
MVTAVKRPTAMATTVKALRRLVLIALSFLAANSLTGFDFPDREVPPSHCL